MFVKDSIKAVEFSRDAHSSVSLYPDVQKRAKTNIRKIAKTNIRIYLILTIFQRKSIEKIEIKQ